MPVSCVHLQLKKTDIKATFDYNADGSRVKTKFTKDNGYNLTRFLIDNKYEISDELNVGSAEYLYLAGDVYSAPAVYIKDKNTDGQWHLYYICRDYLGSITHITDANGALVQELSYDAWGRLRNPADQKVYEPGKEPKLFLGRGYTGHEHLSAFGLINMNARLYDPVLGRFLSPDPYVQAPDFSQNFNRYSYCINNPLKFSDTSGELFGIDDLTFAIIGGVINLGVNIYQGNIHGNIWQCIGQGAAAFGTGAAAGALATYGPVGWAAGGAIVGSTNAWLGGGTGKDILVGGVVGSVSGVAGGYAGQFAANSLGAVVINGFKITSPVLNGAVGGAIGGAASGYAGGFTGGLIMTGDIELANNRIQRFNFRCCYWICCRSYWWI